LVLRHHGVPRPVGGGLWGVPNRIDLLCAAGAGVGVYVFVLPGPSGDHTGLGLALAAAACWASYILLNQLIGARLPGLQAPAVAMAVSALAYLPLLVLLIRQGRLAGAPLLYAIGAGVLSSVMPYAADLIALRAVPVRFFGVFMSVNPVLAAVAGIILLGQVLSMHEWIGIAIVVLVNSLAVTSARRPRDRNANGSRSRSRRSAAAVARWSA
jgi:inner membrane transporter RhtA